MYRPSCPPLALCIAKAQGGVWAKAEVSILDFFKKLLNKIELCFSLRTFDKCFHFAFLFLEVKTGILSQNLMPRMASKTHSASLSCLSTQKNDDDDDTSSKRDFQTPSWRLLALTMTSEFCDVLLESFGVFWAETTFSRRNRASWRRTTELWSRWRFWALSHGCWVSNTRTNTAHKEKESTALSTCTNERKNTASTEQT